MGSVGNCFDNAMIESFCSRLQVELLDRRRWKTRVELANAIFEYIVRDVINLRVKPVLERHDRTKAAGQSPRVLYVLS